MGRLDIFLSESRIARLLGQVEAGEDVDLQQIARLQALDLARVGELFALDAIESEREADEQFRAALQE